jgi:hypothetical protein
VRGRLPGERHARRPARRHGSAHARCPRGHRPAARHLARFTIVVDKALLLASPGRVARGLRSSRTRLTVLITPRKGARMTTTHEGHISVSLLRLQTGAAPEIPLRG